MEFLSIFNFPGHVYWMIVDLNYELHVEVVLFTRISCHFVDFSAQ